MPPWPCFGVWPTTSPWRIGLIPIFFPAERHLDYQFVYWGTRLAVAEMLLSGTTTFCDMYLFTDAVAQAAVDTGIRALVGEVLYDFPSPNYGPPENGLKFTEELLRSYQGHSRVGVAVQPHSVYTCSPKLLENSKALADRYHTRWIIHLAETAREVADCLEHYGATPVGHLHRLGLLQGNTVADHAVALTEADMDLLAASGTGVAHCPESNMKLASGMAPVVDLLARGVPVGLGTDGCASNNNLDMLAELDTAAKLAKVRGLDPTALPAREGPGFSHPPGGPGVGLGRRDRQDSSGPEG
jgi:5-methylthioadenosine/S-adenosylhomocysteine deaminase